MNKFLRPGVFAATLVLLLTGCSTPRSRIQSRQSVFDAWPPAVQEKVRAGRIDLGFTPEMVEVALGAADRVGSRTTEKGTSVVWVYFDHRPKFSIGVGVGGSSGNTAYGTGVVVGDNGWADNEVLRVIFEGAKVAAIEARHK